MVIFGISTIVRHVSRPNWTPPSWSPEILYLFVHFQIKLVAIAENWTSRPKNSKWPLSKTLFLMKSHIFCYNYATKVSNTSILMFSGMLNAMEYSKSDDSEYINHKIQDVHQNSFFATFVIHIRDFTDLSIQARGYPLSILYLFILIITRLWRAPDISVI